MENKILWSITIMNSINMICWTTLAIAFNKWWIAFFALLFMNSLQTKYKTYRICDKCGKNSPYASSHNEAIKKAKAAGWVHCDDDNKDYCPDCQ